MKQTKLINLTTTVMSNQPVCFWSVNRLLVYQWTCM